MNNETKNKILRNHFFLCSLLIALKEMFQPIFTRRGLSYLYKTRIQDINIKKKLQYANTQCYSPYKMYARNEKTITK